MKLFVYGTLMQGFAGHEAYLNGLKPLCTGIVKGELYRLEEGYPIITNGAGCIHGELYEVSEAVMDIIREYEEVFEANPLYEERQTDVETPQGIVTAAVFYATDTHSSRIKQYAESVPSGSWREFTGGKNRLCGG